MMSCLRKGNYSDNSGPNGNTGGVSDVDLNLVYSSSFLEENSANYSLGITLSLPTDDGVDEISEYDKQYDNTTSSYFMYIDKFKISKSKGYSVFTFFGSIGKKFDNKYFYAEYRYHINGERNGYTYVVRDEHNYVVDKDTIKISDYNPTNSAELNLVSSFFTSQKSKFKLKFSYRHNMFPIDENSDENKKNIISFIPTYSHAGERVIYEFGLNIPIKNEYDSSHSFALFLNLYW